MPERSPRRCRTSPTTPSTRPRSATLLSHPGMVPVTSRASPRQGRVPPGTRRGRQPSARGTITPSPATALTQAGRRNPGLRLNPAPSPAGAPTRVQRRTRACHRQHAATPGGATCLSRVRSPGPASPANRASSHQPAALVQPTRQGNSRPRAPTQAQTLLRDRQSAPGRKRVTGPTQHCQLAGHIRGLAGHTPDRRSFHAQPRGLAPGHKGVLATAMIGEPSGAINRAKSLIAQ
jgi:hypothetical protein